MLAVTITACDLGNETRRDTTESAKAPTGVADAVVETVPSLLAAVPSGAYRLDKNHGYVTLSYSHIGFSRPHIGFRNFDVALNLDNSAPEMSSVEVTIDASSVYSRVDEFDDKLKGEDFFDVANHPVITFSATSIELEGADKLRVAGDLTIKGVAIPVVLDATVNKAANHPMSKEPTIGISASTKVNRSDWGLSKFVPLVEDEVTIYIEAEIVQQTGES